jgi:hypothetical protein
LHCVEAQRDACATSLPLVPKFFRILSAANIESRCSFPKCRWHEAPEESSGGILPLIVKSEAASRRFHY